MKNKLKGYGFKEEIVERVYEIVEPLRNKGKNKFEENVARFTIDSVNNIERGIGNLHVIDNCFTLLFLFLSDNLSGFKLDKKIEDIILEGMSIHDYGKEYGPSLTLMRDIADNILK